MWRSCEDYDTADDRSSAVTDLHNTNPNSDSGSPPGYGRRRSMQWRSVQRRRAAALRATALRAMALRARVTVVAAAVKVELTVDFTLWNYLFFFNPSLLHM